MILACSDRPSTQMVSNRAATVLHEMLHFLFLIHSTHGTTQQWVVLRLDPKEFVAVLIVALLGATVVLRAVFLSSRGHVPF